MAPKCRDVSSNSHAIDNSINDVVHTQVGRAWTEINHISPRASTMSPFGLQPRVEDNLCGCIAPILNGGSFCMCASNISPNMRAGCYFHVPGVPNNVENIDNASRHFVVGVRYPELICVGVQVGQDPIKPGTLKAATPEDMWLRIHHSDR